MKKTIFMEKYPVYSLELLKNEIKISSTNEIVKYLKEKILKHPIAEFIAVFDHFEHTKKLGGEMVDGLIDAKNVIFCFGQAIPNTKMLAVRPRSIGICEFEDRVIVEFLEAPKEEMHKLMEDWARDLKK